MISAPVAAPEQFRGTNDPWLPAYPAESEPRGEWWKAFNDPILTDLCERAAIKNGQIQIAAARLSEARALSDQTRADRQPQMGLNISASQASGPLINAAGTQGRLFGGSASLSYELDLFHRLSDARKASSLDAQAALGLAQSTQLLIETEVAQTYFEIRSLDQARDLMRRSVEAYQQALDLVKARFDAGSVTELDVERARIELVSAKSDLLGLDGQRALREHALAVLVGEVASKFQLDEGPSMASLPAIPAGLPANLLSRRPDISAAQANLMAAEVRLGLAKRAWLPNIALTTSGGFASASLADLLLASAQSWSTGLALVLPLLDGGRRKAQIAQSNSRVEGQVAAYRDTVLVGFQEVEDQLSNLHTLSEQGQLSTVQTASATRALELAQSRFDRGLSSQLDVIEAQRADLKAQRAALDLKARRFQATIALIRALGGGWDTSSTLALRSEP